MVNHGRFDNILGMIKVQISIMYQSSFINEDSAT